MLQPVLSLALRLHKTTTAMLNMHAIFERECAGFLSFFFRVYILGNSNEDADVDK
jgi:hypothetical protein